MLEELTAGGCLLTALFSWAVSPHFKASLHEASSSLPEPTPDTRKTKHFKHTVEAALQGSDRCFFQENWEVSWWIYPPITAVSLRMHILSVHLSSGLHSKMLSSSVTISSLGVYLRWDSSPHLKALSSFRLVLVAFLQTRRLGKHCTSENSFTIKGNVETSQMKRWALRRS